MVDPNTPIRGNHWNAEWAGVSWPLLSFERRLCSTSGWGPYVHRESRAQHHLFHQGAIQCGAPFSSFVIFQRIPPLHSNSSSLHPSQYRASANGVQHPEYAIQFGPLPVGDPLCLHYQKGKKWYFQHVFPYSVPSTGDQSSWFEQRGNQRACTS